MVRKLILDLDVGIDDTLALAYVLGSPEVELIGVMTSFGNVRVETSARNALAVLDLFGRSDVPVYLGADRALAAQGAYEPSPAVLRIHGENGVGGCRIPDAAREPVGAEGEVRGSAEPGAGRGAVGRAGDMAPEGRPKAPGDPLGNAAVEFLIEATERYGDELVYVPTGPLTNLALALRQEPGLVRRLRHVTLMGGALTVPGNVSPCAEANIANDPEAADLAFRSGLHATMVGLDVTHQTLLTKQETALWREVGRASASELVRARASFLADMTDYYIDRYLENNPYLGGCSLHDPLSVGVAIDPTLVGTHGVNLKADLVGAVRGRTIGDDERLNEPEKACDVALTVDAPRFVSEFMARINRALGA